MKLPPLFADEKSTHLILLLLTTVNLLLVVTIFLLLTPGPRSSLPKVISVTSATPITRFSIISPRPDSTVSGTVPILTTLATGPEITKAELSVDSQKVQSLKSRQTKMLTIYWDTRVHSDGKHTIQVAVTDNQNRLSYVSTPLVVQNNVSRSVSGR